MADGKSKQVIAGSRLSRAASAAVSVSVIVCGWLAASGPALYGVERGWLPLSVYDAVWHRPMAVLPFRRNNLFGDTAYEFWWRCLAVEHSPTASP